MKIETPAFKHNEMIPARFTCRGEDVNPELNFSDIPENARSLVLIMDDPDAVVGTWVHWTAWNIAPAPATIFESSVPAGSTEGMTSFGKPGYGGPCPPSGTHRYFFKLYALDTKLDLAPAAAVRQLEAAMQGHILAQAELIGLFGR